MRTDPTGPSLSTPVHVGVPAVTPGQTRAVVFTRHDCQRMGEEHATEGSAGENGQRFLAVLLVAVGGGIGYVLST